jgi:hypothetical protein
MKFKVGDLFFYVDNTGTCKHLSHLIITKITGNCIWYAHNSRSIIFRQRHVFENWIKEGKLTLAARC